MPTPDSVASWLYRLDQNTDDNPLVLSPAHHLTAKGTPYVLGPGFCLAGLTVPVLGAEIPYLRGAGKVEEASRLLEEVRTSSNRDFPDESLPLIELMDYPVDDAAYLIKHAGQSCYASWTRGRTHDRETQKYIANLLEKHHISVLEHVSATFMVWGVSRSLVMEWDRQRHLSWSQLSQRYVDETRLRFVMRPEYQDDLEDRALCESDMDTLWAMYVRWLERGRAKQAALESGGSRKKVNQASRWCLPNSAEVPLYVSGNMSAWRHFLTIRGQVGAEPEIRRLCALLAPALKVLSPAVFQDVVVEDGPDGWPCVALSLGGC